MHGEGRGDAADDGGVGVGLERLAAVGMVGDVLDGKAETGKPRRVLRFRQRAR